MSNESLQKLVTELDVLIRARYPLIAANTHEEGRFRRVMHAVANLKCHKEKDKGLYIWSRTTGQRQTVGREVKGKEEVLIANTQDSISVLEYIGKQQKSLFALCDYSPYLAPYGQIEPQLVRRLRELACFGNVGTRRCNANRKGKRHEQVSGFHRSGLQRPRAPCQRA